MALSALGGSGYMKMKKKMAMGFFHAEFSGKAPLAFPSEENLGAFPRAQGHQLKPGVSHAKSPIPSVAAVVKWSGVSESLSLSICGSSPFAASSYVRLKVLRKAELSLGGWVCDARAFFFYDDDGEGVSQTDERKEGKEASGATTDGVALHKETP